MRWACVATVVMWSAFAGADFAAGVGGTPAARAGGVEVKVNEAAKRVDVTIDGKPFTSYVWPSTLKKPVLYPSTAKGTLVTRLLDPPGGARRSSHHVGLWLNHGDVNGLFRTTPTRSGPQARRWGRSTTEDRQPRAARLG